MNRVRELRKEKNISQQYLADSIGISASNLGSIERNETIPSVIIAIDMSKFFGVSVEYLMGFSDERYQFSEGFKVLTSLKGDKLEIIKKISDLSDDQIHDLNLMFDILYKKK